jgi:hypothetical protein
MTGAKKIVDEPNIIISSNGMGNCGNKSEILGVAKIPRVTMVAACGSDDTGVGPSIASGSRMWDKNCADLLEHAGSGKKQPSSRGCKWVSKDMWYGKNSFVE